MRTATKIRNFAQQCQNFDAQSCMKAIGVRRDDFWGVFKDFIKRGEIKKDGELYAINTEYRKKRRGYLFYQVAKAMRISGVFTVDDITMLTQADSSYVNRLLRGFIKDNLVEVSGKKPSPRRKGSYISVYRVLDNDEFRRVYTW